MQADDLISLKDDMVAFIEGHSMRRLPGFITEDLPTVLWEDEDNPDSWKDFVEMAKSASSPFVTMSDVKLEKEDIAMLLEQIRDDNFPDEAAAEVHEAQYLVNYVGKIGYIQLGFAHQGVLFVHENATAWYERYQQLLEFVEDFGDVVFEDDEDEEEEAPLPAPPRPVLQPTALPQSPLKRPDQGFWQAGGFCPRVTRRQPMSWQKA